MEQSRLLIDSCSLTDKIPVHDQKWWLLVPLFTYLFFICVSILFLALGSLTLQAANLVQFSHSVMPNSLRPHGLQHARPPCPSPTPQSLLKLMSVESVMPSNISSSVIPVSSPLQFFPAPGSFQMSQFFASSGQSIGILAPKTDKRNEKQIIQLLLKKSNQ